MSARLRPLDPLQPQQRAASDPAELVWLSASAGTGKTLMAEATAGETERPYVFVDPQAFVQTFLGVAPMKMKWLYRKLRKLSLRYGGVVVFFDEADVLGNRGQLPEDWDRFAPIMTNAIERVPAVEHAEIVSLVNGPEGFTPDNEFVLGESAVRGLFVAAGFCAHGIAGAGDRGRSEAALCARRRAERRRDEAVRCRGYAAHDGRSAACLYPDRAR